MSDAKDIESMSIKELKALITSSGLSFNDCVEKSDLRARAKEARTRLSANPKKPTSSSSSSSGGVTTKKEKFHIYDAIVKVPSSDHDKAFDKVVLFLHGFGATNTDLATLGDGLGHFGSQKVGFVFPQAPTPNGKGMPVPQWWEIDVMKWMMAAGGGDAMGRLIREHPPGLEDARKNLSTMVEHICNSFKIDSSKLVLGGFSQGAMTAMDLSLHLISKNKSIGGVAMISGAPIVVDEWKKTLNIHGKQDDKMKVFLSHGMSDPVLPFACSGWVKTLLEESKVVDLEYVTHAGGHTLGDNSVQSKLFSFLAQI